MAKKPNSQRSFDSEEPEDEDFSEEFSTEALEAIPFQEVLEALLDEDQPIKPRYLYRLTDLDEQELEQFQEAWRRVSDRRRLALLEDIEELSGSNMLLSYEAVCRFVINDPDPKVRTLAVRTLWDFPYLYLLPTFLELLSKDSAAEVRSAAATALGSYIYLGEIEELPEETLHEVEEELLSVANGPDVAEVRRHALESLGYSSRVEVPPMIEAAYYSGQDDWITSALFAMGRSADEVWVPLVVEMLESDNPELRWEAIRAAGELEARETVPRLVELLNEEDPDIYSAAIWSLSQIGGEGVRDLLEQMYAETEDDDELDLIEEALDNLAFTEEVEILDLLEIDEDEDDGQEWEGGEDLDESLLDDEDLED